MKDRVGLSWRGELAAGILANLDRIDVVEIIADDYFDAPREKIRALKTLATQIPIVLHGVSMGLSSSVPVETKRLEKMARQVDFLRPEFWSEHLAFVRGGGYEIGHLAAPPRTRHTVMGSAENLDLAKKVIGSLPLVENVATLLDPPGSDLDEATWVTEILAASGGDLLLDLHNLHANAVNFGFDEFEYLTRIPAERIKAVHLAGGRWVSTRGPKASGKCRLLDDHLHDVPQAVYGLLREVGARAPNPLTVILERDGDYPSTEDLLNQLDRARAALQEGRDMRSSSLSSFQDCVDKDRDLSLSRVIA